MNDASALARISQRLRTLIGRCVLTALRDGAMQGAQVTLFGDPREAEHFEPYGFTSKPLSGAEGIVLCPMGSRDHSIVIQIGDRRYRFTENEDGEVTLYHHEGHRITLRNGGKVEIVATELDAVLTGDAVIQADGNVEVVAGGTLDVTADGKVTVESAADVEVIGATTVTVEGTIELTLKAPIVKIDSLAIQAALGASQGVMLESLIAKYNSHVHNTVLDTGPPTTGVLIQGVDSTTILKGS